PNSFGDSWSDEEGPVENGWEADGELTRHAYDLHAEDDDFGQPGTLVREVFSDAQRDEFVKTVAGALVGVKEPGLCHAFQYWKNVDEAIGQRIEDAVKANAQDPTVPGMGVDADQTGQPTATPDLCPNRCIRYLAVIHSSHGECLLWHTPHVIAGHSWCKGQRAGRKPLRPALTAIAVDVAPRQYAESHDRSPARPTG